MTDGNPYAAPASGGRETLDGVPDDVLLTILAARIRHRPIRLLSAALLASIGLGAAKSSASLVWVLIALGSPVIVLAFADSLLMRLLRRRGLRLGLRLEQFDELRNRIEGVSPLPYSAVTLLARVRERAADERPLSPRDEE